jgi:hypothetical protein
MVSVNDKVFVAPLHGQKENIAIITGPVGQTGGAGTSGIIERNYNMWSYMWSWSVTDGVYGNNVAFYIDEANTIFYLWWKSSSPMKTRFGTYNIADHSVISESSSAIDYLYKPPSITGAGNYSFFIGCQYLRASILRSHQTYVLLERDDLNTIEIWKAGSLLWTHDLNVEGGGSYAEVCAAEMSLTGKYILLYECSDMYKLLLFEGFDAGTSTTVTETVITDTAKSWVTNDLIGHIVYITSGGANGQQGTITSNTGITITCSAATFVTWGMSVGDTFKID